MEWFVAYDNHNLITIHHEKGSIKLQAFAKFYILIKFIPHTFKIQDFLNIDNGSHT
jgi:hypothetical protein